MKIEEKKLKRYRGYSRNKNDADNEGERKVERGIVWMERGNKKMINWKWR